MRLSGQQRMVNENYEPSKNEDEILEVLKDGREAGEPWGISNPMYLREQTGLNKQQVNYALNQLTAAGWVVKLTDGLYRFEADPRDGG
jgi:DNA-binding IclR family transcriptional regulator